jgi:ribosome-binding factor A
MAGRPRRSGGRGGGTSRSASRGGHKYPRSARVGETLREIIAEELIRIDDERLTFVTVTGIEVDEELNRAHVYFDSLAGEDGDEAIIEALTHHRVRLQAAIARQIRAKKTPILDFRPDLALRGAERIDDIIREDRKQRGPLPDDYGIAEDETVVDDAD